MELSLAQKGPAAPPPTLNHPYQTAVDAISDWPGIRAATHWHLYRRGEVDGVDFYVGARELGHIHLDGQVHLATDQALHDELNSSGRAETFPFGGSYRTWVLFQIRNESDAHEAIELFRFNYERLRSAA